MTEVVGSCRTCGREFLFKANQLLACDMDHANKDHSHWYRAVKKARALLTPAAEPACPHCAAGAPFKSPAGSESYHLIEVEGGSTYARCAAAKP